MRLERTQRVEEDLVEQFLLTLDMVVEVRLAELEGAARCWTETAANPFSSMRRMACSTMSRAIRPSIGTAHGDVFARVSGRPAWFTYNTLTLTDQSVSLRAGGKRFHQPPTEGVRLRRVLLGGCRRPQPLFAGAVLSGEPQQPSSPGQPRVDTVDYNWDVRPILSENCFQCHGPDEKADARVCGSINAKVPQRS